MSGSRQLHLGAFMRPTTIHTGAWRYPGAFPDANFNLAHIKHFAQTLEQAKFDAFFMADHLAVLNMPLDALKHSHTVTSFEPFTLLSALAMVTEHIGLVATGSTTFDLPYHVARRFASLDHLSGGRAGWNIVTTSNPDAALNFGMTDHMEHSERYRRAREFYDVVTGLWDSWDDDAFIRDVEHGIFFDPDKPLPDIPESNASKSARDRVVAMGKRENLTVRQLAQRLGGYSGLAMVGTVKTIADEMEEWLTTEASDGFTIMFPFVPEGLEDFCNKVVPELQRRGIFRREYEGKTLRENLGLPRPENRFFETRRAAE